jgi:hypothetical protein
MGIAMYFVISRFQLPLPQVIPLPSRPNQEVAIKDKADFNKVRPSNR